MVLMMQDEKIKNDCKHDLNSFVKAPRLPALLDSTTYVEEEGEQHQK
jgi:hypothetical protein